MRGYEDSHSKMAKKKKGAKSKRLNIELFFSPFPKTGVSSEHPIKTKTKKRANGRINLKPPNNNTKSRPPFLISRTRKTDQYVSGIHGKNRQDFIFPNSTSGRSINTWWIIRSECSPTLLVQTERKVVQLVKMIRPSTKNRRPMFFFHFFFNFCSLFVCFVLNLRLFLLSIYNYLFFVSLAKPLTEILS